MRNESAVNRHLPLPGREAALWYDPAVVFARVSIREALGWLALGAAGVVAAVVAGYLFLGGGEDDPPGASGVKPASAAVGPDDLGVLGDGEAEVGQVAPDFALLDVRDGQTVRKLSDYRGKTVVLNWYASWCGPCRAEMPDFEAAYQALGGAGGPVVFLVVNLQESQSTALGMLNATGATYPAVLDSTGGVADAYRVTGMPTTFFIDKAGVVVASGRGRVTAEALKAELAKLGHAY
jgi:thiol-disulfide isomerase/thioredoxin